MVPDHTDEKECLLIFQMGFKKTCRSCRFLAVRYSISDPVRSWNKEERRIGTPFSERDREPEKIGCHMGVWRKHDDRDLRIYLDPNRKDCPFYLTNTWQSLDLERTEQNYEIMLTHRAIRFGRWAVILAATSALVSLVGVVLTLLISGIWW